MAQPTKILEICFTGMANLSLVVVFAAAFALNIKVKVKSYLIVKLTLKSSPDPGAILPGPSSVQRISNPVPSRIVRVRIGLNSDVDQIAGIQTAVVGFGNN